MRMPPRIAFSTLAFPDATLASAASLGRSWGYSGIELRLIDGELIDPSMPAADRTQVKRTLTASGLPVVAVDSSIRLTDDDPGPELARFLELASDWEAPLVRVFGGALAADANGAPEAARGGCAGARVQCAARRTAWRRHRRGDSRRLLRLLGRGRTTGPRRPGRDRLRSSRRGVGQPSPAPDGRDASRGLRQPRPSHPARAGQGRPPQGRRRLAAGAARRGRGAGQGHAGAAGGRRLPALDLGRVGKALAPRDRGARGGAPPAPGSADQVARVGP